MRFTVNNNITEEIQNISIMDLLNKLGYHKWCLVVLNDKTLLQEEYISTNIKDNDKIRIFKPMFGG